MISKISTLFLIAALLAGVSLPAVWAQKPNDSDDWESLKSYINNEIAVKIENRKTVYGVLAAADADGLRLRRAQDNAEISVRREETEKIWLAELKNGSRNTLKGAGIGAAVGAGIGLVSIAASGEKNDDGLAAAAVPLFAVPGALIGGVAGFFSRKKNKKGRLIYGKN